MVTLMEFNAARLAQWLSDHSDESFVIVRLYEFTDYFGDVTYACEIKGE